MIRQELICKGLRCGEEPKTPLRGTRLCARCTRALTMDLAALPQLYDDCGHLLGGRDSHQVTTRTTGGPLPGLPFNASAADARTQVLTLTAAWGSFVADERLISPPRRTVGELARFLLRHLQWLTTHPAAADFSREVTEAVTAARRVTDPRPQRRVPVGQCVKPGCPGSLTAVVRSGTTRMSGEVVCSADDAHRWPTQEWARLGSRLSPAGPGEARWLSAAEIAQLWSVPTGTVYRLASEHRWTRVSRGGRVRYRADDVYQVFSAGPGG